MVQDRDPCEDNVHVQGPNTGEHMVIPIGGNSEGLNDASPFNVTNPTAYTTLNLPNTPEHVY